MGIRFQKKIKPLLTRSQKNPALRPAPKLRWLFIVLILASPLTYLLYQLAKAHIFMSFPGHIAYDKIIVRSPVDGYIKKLNVHLSQKVYPWQTIVEIKSPEVELKLGFLEKEKQLVKQSLALFDTSDESVLKNELTQAKLDILQTKKVYQQFLAHKKEGTIVSLQLEQARLNWSNAKKFYFSLNFQLYRMRSDRIHRGELFYRRKLSELNKDIAANRALLKRLRIKIDTPARVISIEANESEYVPEGKSILSLSTQKNLHVIGFIPPKFASQLKQGMPVRVVFPDKSVVKGTISQKPSFARRLPVNFVNPIAERSNQIVVIITLDAQTNKNKYVYGLPVRIKR